jgi:hypothetical protein
MSHNLNPLRMDPPILLTSSMHELPRATILPHHGMCDEVSPSPTTLMHPRRIAIPGSWEGGIMAIL